MGPSLMWGCMIVPVGGQGPKAKVTRPINTGTEKLPYLVRVELDMAR